MAIREPIPVTVPMTTRHEVSALDPDDLNSFDLKSMVIATMHYTPQTPDFHQVAESDRRQPARYQVSCALSLSTHHQPHACTMHSNAALISQTDLDPLFDREVF